jgi:phospholipase C
MYYQHMANSHHLPPSSAANVGKTDQAQHQSDLSLFFDALNNGRLPAVSFLKAPRALDGHPGSTNSDPLSEQLFIVDTLNRLQQSAQWRDTAVIIAYDDSDGWYDHVMPPIVNHSNDTTNDTLAGSLYCYGVSTGTAQQLGGLNDRCGYGTRLPLIAISPYAKQNYVDHALTDTTSVLRFIEDNWSLGRIPTPGSFDALAGTLNGLFDFIDTPNPTGRKLILCDSTGEIGTCAP